MPQPDTTTDTARANEIVRGLLADSRFQFHEKGGYLRGGICPDCGKKELYVRKSAPWRIACGRANKCGSSFTAKDLLPHLFENYAKRFPATPENPKATADAYMIEDRGFMLSKCQMFYDQEGHQLNGSGEMVPTARFYLDPERTRFWERLIGKTKADGQKAHVGGKRKPDGSLFKGDAWTPPTQKLKKGDTCFITEGIFHAIALIHAGHKAAASISCSNFCDTFITQNKGKDITWVLAYDGDVAGRKYMKKHLPMIRALGEEAKVCLLPDGRKDWDDLWAENRLTDDLITECFYQGKLFASATVGEKVWHVFCRYPTRRRHVVEFGNAIYSAKVDSKFSTELQEEGVLLDSPEGLERFRSSCTVDMICNVAPEFLYIEKDILINEQRYLFRIRYKNGTPSKLMSVDGTSLATGEAFNKSLLNQTNGGRYTGDNRDFGILCRQWLDGRMLEVQSIPYIGYEDNCNAWIFHDNAFQQGRKVPINEQGYFQLGKQGIKSSLSGIHMVTDGEFDPKWINQYVRAFHFQGLAVLAYFMGSLFAQQIRSTQKSFPFLEFTGEPGAGKSTVLEFCWKLLGRDDYEGFDIIKATLAGRRRAFSQVSNLPIVIIESDRDQPDNTEIKRGKNFNFEEWKPFYNGRATGTLGVASRGNDVDEQLFKASLVISQNAEVEGGTALLERIVHCHADKKHHGPGTLEIARWFERQSSEDVGGFLWKVLQNEKKILSVFFREFKKMEPFFAEGGIRHQRIIKTHSQLAALAHALQVIFPDLPNDTIHDFICYLGNRAKARQEKLAADHPTVEKFWETFHYINDEKEGGMDLSTDDRYIAVSLNHYRAMCVFHQQEVPDMSLLKKHLSNSKRYKLVDKNRAVWDRFNKRTVKCWVFKK
jgi:hypothetical protein